jgi:IS605 OrfB family transposase
MADGIPATQRAYTLRLSGDEAAQEALWRTHESVNKGVKAFGDWLLTLRGGLDHKLADASAKQRGGRKRRLSDEEKRNRRIVLALSWLSVESERGAPAKHIVASGKNPQADRQKKLVAAFRGILKQRGLNKTEVDEWVGDCSASLGAAIRDDAVWVDRSAIFDEAVSRIGKSLSRTEVWDLLERFFGSKDAYLDPMGLEEDEAGPSEKTKDLVQKAGQWLSSRFGTGKGADFRAMADAYKRIATWARSATASATTRAMAGLARTLKAPTVDLDGILSVISGPGYKSATRNLLNELGDQPKVSRDNLARLAKAAEQDHQKCQSKVGRKGKRPWANAILAGAENECGFSYLQDDGAARHSEFAVMLDHAARRVSAGHAWIKRAEAERRGFEEDARRIGHVPDAAKKWLDAFCDERSRSSGSLEGYRIRKRAADGWEHVVRRWVRAGCTTTADRIAVARELQSDPEIDKFGDIQLFEALAADAAACVWKPDGKPLKDYVAASDAEFRKRRFKVPAYRHPDPLLHPVFCDFGCSRWRIAFDVHEQRKSRGKKRKGAPAETDPHGLTMRLWDGNSVVDVRLHWRGKRLHGDLGLDDTSANTGTMVSRADRLGRAAIGAGADEPVKIAGLFEDKDWNGRLQAPRAQLDAIAGRAEKHGWDAKAVRMRERIEWLVTFSAKLRPQGPWISYASEQALELEKKLGKVKLGPERQKDEWRGLAYPFWHPRNEKGRKGRAKHLLSRLPGLRVLSVDLGHRYAAACAMWEAVSAAEVRKACKQVGHSAPKAGDLYLHLRHNGRTTIYRRIGADKVEHIDTETGEVKEVTHPAPWSRLERQFLIKLQGEDETPRKASAEELAAVEELEHEIGPAAPEGRSLRVDELMSEAVRTARLALRRHAHRARIAHYLVATKKVVPGGTRKDLDESGRVELIADALGLWYDLAASSRWKDDWASTLWNEQAWASYVPLQKRDEETATRQAIRKGKQDRREKLKPAAEGLVRDKGRCKEASEAWAERWGEEDALWHKRLRRLRNWILPRGKAREDASIRHVGGLSLTRLATIRSLWQVQKAFFTRITPEGRQMRDGEPVTAGEGFGRRILGTLEHMREQRVKQIASRIVEAALGVGREQRRRANGKHAKRPRERVHEPCHAVVIENLTYYRPEETRTRRENRQLMRWSAAKVKKYLAELCQLHGLHLREVQAGYTSRQDSRTGAPGARCQDVPVREFMKSPFWRKQVAQAEKKSDGKGGARDRFLCDLDKKWKGTTEEEWNVAPPVRVPLNGGELFVSADGASPAAKGLQADLNAAANIGLRALLDPDWPGAWWYVPCDAKTMKPTKDKVKGGAAANVDAALAEPPDEGGAKGRGKGKKSRTIVNLWRDVSAKPVKSGDWRGYAPYWNHVAARVVNTLRRQTGLGVDRTE